MIKPPQDMCCVYLLSDESVLVEGFDYEPTGPGGLASDRLVRISRSAREVLGPIVLRMLDQTMVVNGAEWNEKGVLRSRLEITGEKSQKAFETRARMVNVTLDGERITVTPSAHDAKYGGWQYLDDKKAECKIEPVLLTSIILNKLGTS